MTLLLEALSKYIKTFLQNIISILPKNRFKRIEQVQIAEVDRLFHAVIDLKARPLFRKVFRK
jgi:hypothetical protein